MDSYYANRKTLGYYHRCFHKLKKYPQQFKNAMRMEVSTFEYILNKVQRLLEKNWCNFHQCPIYPEEKVVLTLRFLAFGKTYSDLATDFLIHPSTISGIIIETVDALWHTLCPEQMPLPNKDSLFDIAQSFYLQWDIPHCCGAIYVHHIRIQKPPKSGALYYNFKGFYSIPLQALVDANYRFITIDVGGYGHQHDATTFRFSTLYESLKNKTIEFPEEDQLYKSRVVCPYYVVGDGAYPGSKNLLKPYPGNNLSPVKKIFNKRLSRARQTVECAFGHMCQKWRLMYMKCDHSPEIVEKIVKAVCILHNTIINLENSITEENVNFYADIATVLVADEDGISDVLTGDGRCTRKKTS